MQQITRNSPAEFDEPAPVTLDRAEQRGCLFALSQPPLMFFLAFIGALLAICGIHDLFWL